jgi:hypothetical protein
VPNPASIFPESRISEEVNVVLAAYFCRSATTDAAFSALPNSAPNATVLLLQVGRELHPVAEYARRDRPRDAADAQRRADERVDEVAQQPRHLADHLAERLLDPARHFDDAARPGHERGDRRPGHGDCGGESAHGLERPARRLLDRRLRLDDAADDRTRPGDQSARREFQPRKGVRHGRFEVARQRVESGRGLARERAQVAACLVEHAAQPGGVRADLDDQ